MAKITNFIRHFFLSILCISIFDVMAIGLNVYIPIGFFNILFLSFFRISGFICLVFLYTFII